MIKGFKDFIMKGNVLDLAVAVVIGAAFTAIVTSVVEGFINPLIAAIFGKPNLNDVGDLHHQRRQVLDRPHPDRDRSTSCWSPRPSTSS